MTVIIPERGNSDLLDQCLASVDEAGRHMEEPLQVIVAANGIQDEDYTPIRGRYPRVEFVCQAAPLTFCGAVRAGLKRARHDWVYLLNNDMTLEPGALQTLADERRDSVFALASRIVLADRGLLSYETNWTSYRVRDELLEVYHAAPPQGAGPFEILFGGGGCTLYRRALLEQYLGRFDPYAPFYFERTWIGPRAAGGTASRVCCAPRASRHTSIAQPLTASTAQWKPNESCNGTCSSTNCAT
jgi:GT2 family glycosyltransferase